MSMHSFVRAETTRVGVIGSRTSLHFTADVFERMKAHCLTQLRAWGLDPKKVQLVSGGCTWGDHVAVVLALEGEVESAVIHLPCGFEKVARADGTGTIAFKGIKGDACAHMLARLHAEFSRSGPEARGEDSLVEMRRASDIRGRLVIQGHPTFDKRNAVIADSVQYLIAFVDEKDAATQGPSRLSPGTRFTWNHYHAVASRGRGGDSSSQRPCACIDLRDMDVEMPEHAPRVSETDGPLVEKDASYVPNRYADH